MCDLATVPGRVAISNGGHSAGGESELDECGVAAFVLQVLCPVAILSQHLFDFARVATPLLPRHLLLQPEDRVHILPPSTMLDRGEDAEARAVFASGVLHLLRAGQVDLNFLGAIGGGATTLDRGCLDLVEEQES